MPPALPREVSARLAPHKSSAVQPSETFPAHRFYDALMPTRLKRYYNLKHLHFIACSCYHRLPLLGTPGARDFFLTTLEETRLRYRFVVVGYVVMPEHFHLLVSEPEVGDPSVVMKVLKERSSRRLRAILPPRPFANGANEWATRPRVLCGFHLVTGWLSTSHPAPAEAPKHPQYVSPLGFLPAKSYYPREC